MTPKHSNLGPSSAERWMNCPGSVAATKNLKNTASVHAAEGTVAHALCEEFVTGKLSLPGLTGRIGRVTEESGFEIEVTAEMVDAVIEYRDTIHADTNALGEKYPDVNITGLAEVRVIASSVSPDLYGTADYILVARGRKLIVYDFKYGKGVAVDVQENKQMAIYALAALDTLGLDTPGARWDEIELVVIQPRAGGESVRRWSMPFSWFGGFIKSLPAAVKAAQTHTSPRIPSPKACRWCAYKPACPEAHAEVQKQAMIEFADAPKELEKGRLPDISGLPVQVLIQALEHEEYVTGWFESVRMHLKQKLEAGLPVPGYKLVEGRANRKYIDELRVIEAFEDIVGTDALLEPRKLISPAKLEKLVGKGKLDGLTFKPEGGKSIVRESDPRPEAKNRAELDFAPDALDEALGLKKS